MVQNWSGQQTYFWGQGAVLSTRQVYLVQRSVRKQNGFSFSLTNILLFNGCSYYSAQLQFEKIFILGNSSFQNMWIDVKGCVQVWLLIYCLFSIMIHFIDQIEVSINERLDHLTTLLIDSEQLSVLVKDEDKRRNIVKNFRVIKSAEKIRVANEQRFLKQMEKASTVLSKAEVIACESMLANCMNQYLNSDYEVRKTGEPNDLVDIFMFYYECINAKARVCQLTVIKNCGLVTDLNFLHENIMFMLGNMQSSLNYVYQSEKNKFFALTKNDIKIISPEKKEEEEEQKFDSTGRLTIANKSKKKVQQYCFDLSKLLDLEGIYLNYYYFNSIDSQKRKKTLVSNFMKRNVHIKRIMSSYENQYRVYKQKHKK